MIPLNEQSLLRRLECPTRSRSLVPTSALEPDFLTCAERTARWITDEFANRRQPTASDTRAYYDTVWTQTAYFQRRDAIPCKQYEAAVRKGMRICCRLRDVLWRCEILEPVTSYQLQVGGMVLTGEYAVLRSSRRKNHGFALYLRHDGIKLRPLVPDVVSFARRLDLGDRWIQSGNSNVGWAVKTVSVLHYWIAQDLQLEHRPDRPEAADVLEGAASVITGNPFPIPGPHCRTCPTRACRPDALVRPGGLGSGHAH